MSSKMNSAIDLPLSLLEDRLQTTINGHFKGYERIVSLKEIERIDNMSFLEEKVFKEMIRKIPLRGEPDVCPYSDSDIKIFGVEPKGIMIGQTFVQSTKIINIMKSIGADFFNGYVTTGIAKMPPAQVYGRTKEQEKAIAFYMPPIIEVHNNYPILIDGMHRGKICFSAGTSINAIHIYNSSIPVPFKPIEWGEVQIVDEKPPIEERYHSLNKRVFRDLGAVGIDG